MSQFITQNKRRKIVLGVDRRLEHTFVQVWSLVSHNVIVSETASATVEGGTLMLQVAATYCKVPADMRNRFFADIGRVEGGDINQISVYPPGAALPEVHQV